MITINDSVRIGVKKLISIIGVERPHFKDVSDTKGYKPKYCSRVHCSFYQQLQNSTLSEEQKELLISGMCEECALEDKKAKKYIDDKNEKYSYKIEKELLLSKSKLKQFILHHATCDTFGVTKQLSIKEVADELRYSERTIKDNMKYFTSNNLLYVCKITPDRFSSAIADYKDYFKSREEYGRGYIEIPKEIIQFLLSANDINEMRFILRGLIKNSQTNRADDEIKAVSYSFDDIKNFLPRHINCPKKIERVVSVSTKNIFNVNILKSGIELKLKPEFELGNIKSKNIDKYKVALTLHILKQGRLQGREILGEPVQDIFSITDIERYMPDFIQMCQQYNLEIVLYGIEYLIGLILKTDYVGNYGGTVRNRIKELLYGKSDSLAV